MKNIVRFIFIALFSIISSYSFSQIVGQSYKSEIRGDKIILRQYDKVLSYGDEVKEFPSSIVRLDQNTCRDLYKCVEYCREKFIECDSIYDFSGVDYIENEIIYTNGKILRANYKRVNNKSRVEIVLMNSDYYENILGTNHIEMLIKCYTTEDFDEVLKSIKYEYE